jgi:hypothetical protein
MPVWNRPVVGDSFVTYRDFFNFIFAFLVHSIFVVFGFASSVFVVC